MIEDRTEGKLEAIRAFAAKAGRTEDFQKQLDYLSEYSDKETKCVLYRDFAPHSLQFTMQVKREACEWVDWFFGGLIFHSSHDGYGSGEAPSLSVCLNPTDGWSVHT